MVTVGLLCMGLAHKTEAGNDELLKVVMTAGLFHDVGELYINPRYLENGVQLSAEEWKHIASHPIVANRLLQEMPQIGRVVGKIVLEHHERLDGFGYPQGLSGTEFGDEAQILACAELLAGLLNQAGVRSSARNSP